MSKQEKKIQVPFECCPFEAEWSGDYFVVKLHGKALYYFSNDTVTWFKEHYQTKYL